MGIENSEIIPNEPSLESRPSLEGKAEPLHISFCNRFFQSFLPAGEETKPAQPRKVCCHKENADKVRAELEKVKEELQNELEEELIPMIQEVIDPMLREVIRIERLMHKETEEGVAGLQFQEWTQGAMLWVELFSKNKDKKLIKAEVVKHVIARSMEKIERDIRYIEGYFEQFFKQLDVSADELNAMRIKKTKLVSKNIQQLRSLQVIPANEIQFEQINEWRHRLDNQRAKHFENALHAIDL